MHKLNICKPYKCYKNWFVNDHSCSALLYTTNCNPKRHQSVQISKSFGLQPVTILRHAVSSLKKLLARFVSLLLLWQKNLWDRCLYMHSTFPWSCTAETLLFVEPVSNVFWPVYNHQDRIVRAYMYVIEHWLKAKVAEFSIARLEFSLLYLPHTFDSLYTLPH